METDVCRKEGGPEDRLDPSNANLSLNKAGSTHAQDSGMLSSEQCAMKLWNTSKTAHTCPVHQRQGEIIACDQTTANQQRQPIRADQVSKVHAPCNLLLTPMLKIKTL